MLLKRVWKERKHWLLEKSEWNRRHWRQKGRSSWDSCLSRQECALWRARKWSVELATEAERLVQSSSACICWMNIGSLHSQPTPECTPIWALPGSAQRCSPGKRSLPGHAKAVLPCPEGRQVAKGLFKAYGFSLEDRTLQGRAWPPHSEAHTACNMLSSHITKSPVYKAAHPYLSSDTRSLFF